MLLHLSFCHFVKHIMTWFMSLWIATLVRPNCTSCLPQLSQLQIVSVSITDFVCLNCMCCPNRAFCMYQSGILFVLIESFVRLNYTFCPSQLCILCVLPHLKYDGDDRQPFSSAGYEGHLGSGFSRPCNKEIERNGSCVGCSLFLTSASRNNDASR